MRKLKVAVIGAGSTYTPELIDGFLSRADRLGVSAFYMMDIDTRKNAIVSAFARRMVTNRGLDVPVIETTDLSEAISGADYVIAQIRVGKLPARVLDEKIPLKHGLIGQETVGVGGFFKALRTIPVISNVADMIEKTAPSAWLINFSNPSGILAEMLSRRGTIRSIGLCNAPMGIEKLMRRKLGELTPSDKLEYDYVGLNHFNWITKVQLNGADTIDKLFEEEEAQQLATSPGAEFLRAIGGIPSYYLNYFYNREKTIADLKARKTTRGEDCMAIEKELLELYSDEKLVSKPEQLDKRGGAFYSEAAVSLIDSIENDLNRTHVINTNHKGTIPFLGEGDVAEVKCTVGKDGPRPLPLMSADVNEHIIGMVQAVKAYEKLTIKAGLTGDYNAGLAALLTNPLVGDYAAAKAVYDEMLEAHKEFLPQMNGVKW